MSNSTPLIYLGELGDLELLKTMFGVLIIAPGVYLEVVVHGAGLKSAAAVAACTGDWIRVGEAQAEEAVHRIAATHQIHLGESETILLASAIGAEVVLMDDRRGIEAARQRGLHTVRTTALYLMAKRWGRIPSVREKLDRLREAGFWLSPSDRQKVLELAGEA